MDPRTVPFVLAPVPGWLRELAGGEVTRAWAWMGPALRLRAVSAGTAQRFEVVWRPSLAVYRLDEAEPARRVAVPLTPALGAALRRFLARLAWLGGAPEPSGHVAPHEVARAALLRALPSLKSPEDARALRPLAAASPAAAIYLALVDGDWDAVFRALDAGELDGMPGWLRTLLAVAHGRADAVQRHAEAPSESEGALAMIEGAALELYGLPQAALLRYVRASEELGGRHLGDVCLRIGKMLRVRGQEAEAAEWIRRALVRGDSEGLLARAVTELIACEAFDDAHAVLAHHAAGAPEPSTVLVLAQLLAWAGQDAEAARWLARIPDATGLEVERLRGVVHALAGRFDEAERALLRAQAHGPDDMETLLWRGELALRRGEREASAALLAEARTRVQTPVHDLLTAALEPPGEGPGLPALAPLLALLGAPSEPWREDRTAAALAVVGRFGGNRGELLTRCVPGRAGLGLERVRLPRTDSVLSSRDASAELVRAVGTIPLAELEAKFDALAREYPDSPHPHCYRGEVDLWLGEYERALSRFDEGLARGRARWAYVGRAAGEILLGRHAEAEATLARCAQVHAPVRGATTHVYLGEMWRLRGEHARAIEELSEAVSAKPGRVAAWMQLALCHHALGRRDEAESIFARVMAEVPRLVWDAWRELGERPCWPLPTDALEPALLAALRMMRGNRSSHTITYFDAGGTLSVARRGPPLRAVLARHAPFLALSLRNQLASG